MAKSVPWFSVLESARKLDSGGRNFTAGDLVVAAGFSPTKSSTASQIATAWLSKFVKWRYAEVVGRVDGDHGRPTSSYALTELGRTCEPKEGQGSRLDRLVGAVRAYQKARGGKTDAQAWAALLKTADEVER